ncbi:MAG TPA: alpha-mannosidase [Anaerolineaceae bacterium]
MQKHYELTLKRLAQFASDSNLRGKIYTDREPVRLASYAAPGRITYQEAMRGQYQVITQGYQFAPFWSTHWVKVEIRIPEEWRGREVHLLWDSNSEACVWQDGEPLQGLTGSSSGWSNSSVRPDFCLTKAAKGGEEITLYIEVACNGLFGLSDVYAGGTLGVLKQAEIAVFDREAWDLFWDYKVISDMAQQLPLNSPRGGQALATANNMVNQINLDDRSTWVKARQMAARFLAARNGDGQHNLSAVGHAHIDTAWLWPLAETRRKCVRTFSSALRYMEEYPAYKFACSQAQQWEWMKELYPGLYERMRARVKSGQFIPAGGSWVEPDCNIPSGESLVRQFLFGQRFFQKEFGITCHEFWEPDVFGYSAALPQILRGVGMTHFLTIKLSWSQFNKISSHTFLWEGLDGSRVLTHFPPADTYNAEATVKDVVFSVNNFKDHERARESYMLFGYGDGGGGPTKAMIEQVQRMADVDGLARVAMRSPEEFFQRCEADIQDPTVWVGELYLELHRGTYTTQAKNKKYNRASELLLRDVEFLAAMAHTLKGAAYPAAELARLWKLVLTSQFHDIIPGSSIMEVYRDSDVHYADVLASGANLRMAAVKSLAASKVMSGEHVLVVNTLSAPRCEVVELPEGTAGGQVGANGKPLGIVSAPAMGYAVTRPQALNGEGVRLSETDGGFILENAFLRAVLYRDGHVASLVEKGAERESVAAGMLANHFVLFDDEPTNWDAWDVDAFHLEKRYEVPGARVARVLEAGPLRAAVEFEYQLSEESTLKQVISLTALSLHLDFATEVDWHERHKFLKVEFPLEVRTQNATYEIQFGHLQRPTHANTSWDMARFEVCGHKWADLSENDFGVTLFNDCKYGFGAQQSPWGNMLRLSLLRSPKLPDPGADMGSHSFRYALMPHRGSLQQAGVVAEGYRFNVPLQILATDAAMEEVSYFQVDLPGVVIDTVKKAEDSTALIVRMYEAHGSRGAVRLTSPLPVKKAAVCNLLETEDQPLEWKDGGVSFPVRPFQIVTLKLEL